MYKKVREFLVSCLTGAIVATSIVGQVAPVTTVYANESITEELRAEIESSLYDFEYYCMANEDVAVALNYDEEKMYEHWINFGMAEGRNASMVFNAKYYLEVNPSVKAVVGTDYIAAYEHFVTTGLLAGLESSPVFDVKYYLEANQDVAEVFENDYVKAANHFNSNALAEGRSGSGNFDYTVYKDCNTDVADLYGDEIKGYYIHYINHGRAEGRTAGLEVSTPEREEVSIISVVEDIDSDVISNEIDLWGYHSDVSPISQFVASKNRYGVAYVTEEEILMFLYEEDLTLSEKISISYEEGNVGGVISDEDGNFYVVYGIANTTDDLSQEVMRIVKYNEKGEKLDSVSYIGKETSGPSWYSEDFGTKIPFDAGNCDLAWNGTILACNYAREMYNGHQSNNVLYIDTTTMEKVNWEVCYTSHSFDQRVIATEDGGFLFADHGDAYSRAFMINKVVADEIDELETFHFREGSNSRSHGYNETYAQLGDLAELSNSYVLVGASERTLSLEPAPTNRDYCGHSEARDLFIQFIKKDFDSYQGADCYEVEGEERPATGVKRNDTVVSLKLEENTTDYGVIWLTDYEDEYFVYNPKVVTTDSNDIIIMWQKVEYKTEEVVDSFYMILGADGKIKEAPVSMDGIEFTCNEDVVYIDGKIYWTIPDGKKSLVTYCFTLEEEYKEVDKEAVSYRIFDAQYYLQRYPMLLETIGTDELDLYSYWMNVGIYLGQSASPVLVPMEYLQMNTDVAEAVEYNFTEAILHFLNYGIYEGRSGSKEFDYTVYQYCNTDVVEVFGEDIVGYYYHYVKHGKAEGRTARLTIKEEASTPEILTVVPEGTKKFMTPDGIMIEMIFEDGRMDKQKIYNTEGILQEELEYYYFNDEENTYILRRLPNNNSILWHTEYLDGSIKSRVENGLNSVLAYVEILSENEDGTLMVQYKKIEDKMIIEEEYDEQGNVLYKEEEFYDEENNFLEERVSDYSYEDGILIGWKTRVKNVTGRIIGREEYDAEGRILSKKKIIYDEQDSFLEEIISKYFYKEGILTGWIEQVYDAENMLKKTIEYDADGNKIIPERIIESTPITIIAEGRQMFRISEDENVTLVFDENGQIVSQEYYDNSGNLKEKLDYYYYNDEENTYILEKLLDYESIAIVLHTEHSNGTVKSKAESGLEGIYAYVEILSENEDNTLTIQYKKIDDKIITREEYDEKGKLLFKQKEVYDEENNLLEIVTENYNEKGEVLTRQKEMYNKENTFLGAVISEYYYEEHILIGWKEQIFDTQYVLKEIIEYDAEGNLINTTN